MFLNDYGKTIYTKPQICVATCDVDLSESGSIIQHESSPAQSSEEVPVIMYSGIQERNSQYEGLRPAVHYERWLMMVHLVQQRFLQEEGTAEVPERLLP